MAYKKRGTFKKRSYGGYKKRKYNYKNFMAMKQTNDKHNYKLTYVDFIASSGAGLIQNVISIGRADAYLGNWSEFSALYDEYRINYCKLTLIPCDAMDTKGWAHDILVGTVDNDDITALPSLSAALQINKSKQTMTNKHMTLYWKNTSLNDINTWQNIGDIGSAVKPSFKLYAESLTYDARYYWFKVEWYITFKGQR